MYNWNIFSTKYDFFHKNALHALTPIGTLAEVLTLPETAKGHLRAGETDSADIATIALKMRETAGNDYQNLSIGSNFAVQLIATQYTYEEDSFDDQYDAAAPLKFTVSDTTEINDALATAKAQNRGAYLLLDEDITIDNNATIPCLSNGGTTVYNLDGHTLTSTNQGAQYLSNGASLSFYNGSMELSAGNPLYANFLAQKNCSITAVDVNVESEGVPFMAAGDAAFVKVVRSNITGGVYCVGTNAGTLDNYGVIIDLKDSTFTSTAYSGQDNCAICLNVEGTLNIDNCDITGGRQGVMVRAGTANIKNSEIKTLGNYTNKTQYYTGNWGSGNEVPAAALVVGNNPNRYVNYYADAVCTLSNTNIYADNDFAKIFVDSNTNTNSASYGQYSTKLTYSGGNVTSDMITAGPGTAVTIVDAN